MTPLRRALLCGLSLLLTACAAPTWQVVPVPDPGSAVPPTACRVVLVREGKLVGRVREVRVYDNGEDIGALGEKGYLCWDRAPGRGVGRVVFAGYDLDGGPVENVFDLPREGGTIGWFAIRLRREDRKPMVEAVTPQEGQALIAERKPAELRK